MPNGTALTVNTGGLRENFDCAAQYFTEISRPHGRGDNKVISADFISTKHLTLQLCVLSYM